MTNRKSKKEINKTLKKIEENITPSSTMVSQGDSNKGYDAELFWTSLFLYANYIRHDIIVKKFPSDDYIVPYIKSINATLTKTIITDIMLWDSTKDHIIAIESKWLDKPNFSRDSYKEYVKFMNYDDSGLKVRYDWNILTKNPVVLETKKWTYLEKTKDNKIFNVGIFNTGDNDDETNIIKTDLGGFDLSFSDFKLRVFEIDKWISKRFRNELNDDKKTIRDDLIQLLDNENLIDIKDFFIENNFYIDSNDIEKSLDLVELKNKYRAEFNKKCDELFTNYELKFLKPYDSFEVFVLNAWVTSIKFGFEIDDAIIESIMSKNIDRLIIDEDKIKEITNKIKKIIIEITGDKENGL